MAGIRNSSLRDSTGEMGGSLATYIDTLDESKKGNLDPSNPKHANLINAITSSIQSGQLDEPRLQKLMRMNKNAAPVFAAAYDAYRSNPQFQRQELLSQYFQPSQEQNVITGGEDDQMVRFEQTPAKNDVQGAITAALNRGDVKLAQELGFNSPSQNRSEYFKDVPTTELGYVNYDARRGKFIDTAGNEIKTRLTPVSADPVLQGRIAGSRKSGEVTAGAQAQAQVDLPSAETDSVSTIRLVEELKNHPGLPYAVGVGGVLPKVPGTAQADFISRLEQLQGKQFLEAYQTLKGGGQITEVEGTKAQNAIARMQRSQTDKEFKKAATEFQDAVRTGVAKLRRKAGVTQEQNKSISNDRKSKEDAALRALRGR